MGRPAKITPEILKEIKLHKDMGFMAKDVADKYGIHPSTITRAYQRLLRKQAGLKVTEGAVSAIHKLNEAIRVADPVDDRDFLLKSATALLDRDGHSPQAAVVQITNTTNTQVNIAPLFSANEAADVRKFLGGEPERGADGPDDIA